MGMAVFYPNNLRFLTWQKEPFVHIFLGLLDPDPDPLVRGMDPDPDPALDPDPSIIKEIK
jgi:hypothetical protein